MVSRTISSSRSRVKLGWALLLIGIFLVVGMTLYFFFGQWAEETGDVFKDVFAVISTYKILRPIMFIIYTIGFMLIMTGILLIKKKKIRLY